MIKNLNIFKTTVELLREHPNATILDIGANIGIYSFFSVRLGYNCHAFEPHSFYFAELEKRRSLLKMEKALKVFNNIGQLKIWNLALTNTKGKTKLYLHDKKPGSHSMVQGKVESEGGCKNPKTLDVFTNTIDIWTSTCCDKKSIDKIKLIKIDVEAAEVEVIKGGISFISEFKPHLIIEVRGRLSEIRRDTLSEIIDMLAPLGYKLYVDSTLAPELNMGKPSLFSHSDVLFSTMRNVQIDKCFTEGAALTRQEKMLRLFNRIIRFQLANLTTLAIKEGTKLG